MQHELKAGYEFGPTAYELSQAILSKYLRAVEESSGMYQTSEVTMKVPPMAVAAYAMRALSDSFQPPPGTMHISQEFEFLKPVYADTTIACRATIAQLRSRGSMRLLSVDLSASNQDGEKVLSGRATLILPG